MSTTTSKGVHTGVFLRVCLIKVTYRTSELCFVLRAVSVLLLSRPDRYRCCCVRVDRPALLCSGVVLSVQRSNDRRVQEELVDTLSGAASSNTLAAAAATARVAFAAAMVASVATTLLLAPLRLE